MGASGCGQYSANVCVCVPCADNKLMAGGVRVLANILPRCEIRTLKLNCAYRVDSRQLVCVRARANVLVVLCIVLQPTTLGPTAQLHWPPRSSAVPRCPRWL